MRNQELLAILRCPADGGELTLHQNKWLICNDCERKYPIREDIPVMLVEEGERYRETAVTALPDPDQESAG